MKDHSAAKPRISADECSALLPLTSRSALCPMFHLLFVSVLKVEALLEQTLRAAEINAEWRKRKCIVATNKRDGAPVMAGL